MKRIRLEVRGQVQGVGFRPQVFQLAKALTLTGWVKNTAAGVLIEVQGTSAPDFWPRLREELPPLAEVDEVQSLEMALFADESDFTILPSDTGLSQTRIPPDLAICEACLGELFDPDNRYYRYPFVNCTHCGPRFSLIKGLPYDRPLTTMAEFPLCSHCQKAYEDPNDRRYHAQPTACADCGPQLSHNLEEIRQAIVAGKILAIKGLGGYQIICDANNAQALARLRERKQRPAKPFALMVLNLASAASWVEIDSSAAQALQAAERPIVLLRKKNNVLPELIAPGLTELGLMLPATPLHYLLFHALCHYPKSPDWLMQTQEPILVVTSANLAGEPLIYQDEIAKTQLAGVVDLIVSYNREIINPVDDSVVKVIAGQSRLFRRARGYAPRPINLPEAMPPTLALGGHLKNTFCLTRDREAFVSQHIGSLTNKASIDFYHQRLEAMIAYLGVKPERIVHDQHPDFYTSRLAYEWDLPAFAVQHHHAHLAAVLVEHGLSGPLLGLALDGYGYGDKGQAWGGELFLLEDLHCQHLASLKSLPLPGGERAVKEPWRLALGWLVQQGYTAGDLKAWLSEEDWPLFLSQAASWPQTSSCGRLFDTAAALIGLCRTSYYEGQAAMQLEALASQTLVLPEGWRIEAGQLNLDPCLQAIYELKDKTLAANYFHGCLIEGLTDWVSQWAQQLGLTRVIGSGGCFANKRLSEGLLVSLQARDFTCYLAGKIPGNDGGLALGQAWIGGRMEGCA